ncbi:MAG TPA: methyltransferase domain-containing protein [Thermodesulfovibrionales bacterium]|nr:methyltransferase domain-containing protein [Thermodesulfovibrionales bacterium]
MVMLHVGCGDVYFDGWINIDVDSPRADLHHNMRKPLPCGPGTIDFIYSEHFLEHLTVQEALDVLREFHRVLKSGGVVRIATPDLRYLLLKYFFLWKRQDWIKKYGYEWMKTKAEMINLCFKEWGHQYLYDREELERRLKEAGFMKLRRQHWNASAYAELRKRETRRDSRLVIEAIK